MNANGVKPSLKRGVMMDIFLEDTIEKQIKEIQKIENLKDERDVIYRALQNYFEVVTKKDKISSGGRFKKTSQTSFNGSVDFLQVGNILKKTGEEKRLDRLSQNKIYGLDGAGIIWIFHNRLLPVKFSLMCISQMIAEKGEPWIDLDDLKKYAQDSAESFVERLETFPDVENKFGARSGFPRSILKMKQSNENVMDDKILLSHYRSKKRFSEQFVGRKLRVREIKSQRLLSESYNVGGACFEMGLIDAKSTDGDNLDERPKERKKTRIVVTLNEKGLKFASMKNNLLDFVYEHSETKPKEIFSVDEREFYLNEILPKFEFENMFVSELIKGGTVESSHLLKDIFEKMYMKFLKTKFPDRVNSDFKLASYGIRIRALVIMARLIEFGIFKKQPGTKSGPYVIQQV
jgi:hypothetical protein